MSASDDGLYLILNKEKKIDYENRAYNIYVPFIVMTKFLHSTYFSI